MGTIEVFDLAGSHLSTFGGARPRRRTVPRRAAAAHGHSRRPRVGSRLRGRGGSQEFTAAGAFVASFPDPPQPPDPAGLASRSRASRSTRSTGDVLVADNWNQRVQRFAPDGTLLTVFGERGSFPPAGMNYPRSVAVDPATRNVWVAQLRGRPRPHGATRPTSSRSGAS